MIKDNKRKITFIVDEDVYDKIQLLATESHRSMSNYCSLVITSHVTKKSNPVKRPRKHLVNA